MVKIMGFDPSKSTGYSVYEPERVRQDRNYSHVVCGVFEMPEKAGHYYTGDQIGLKVRNLIKEYGKPDFAVLEEQILAPVAGSSANAMIYPWIATTAIVAVLANFGVPYGTLMPSQWRKAYYGSAFKPPLDKNGKKDWKNAAVAQCERDGIKLPKQKTIAHNAAEACALAICWASNDIKLHAGRYHQPWMDLRLNKGSVAA